MQAHSAFSEAALRLRKDDGRIYSNLAVTLRGMGRLNEAVAAMKQACSVNPGDSVLHRNLGVLLSEAGENEPAEKELRHAIETAPSDAENHRELGRLLAREKRGVEALAEYSIALKLAPRSADLQFELGHVYLATADPVHAAAAQYCARALSSDPLTIQNATRRKDLSCWRTAISQLAAGNRAAQCNRVGSRIRRSPSGSRDCISQTRQALRRLLGATRRSYPPPSR